MRLVVVVLKPQLAKHDNSLFIGCRSWGRLQAPERFQPLGLHRSGAGGWQFTLPTRRSRLELVQEQFPLQRNHKSQLVSLWVLSFPVPCHPAQPTTTTTHIENQVANPFPDTTKCMHTHTKDDDGTQSNWPIKGLTATLCPVVESTPAVNWTTVCVVI